MFFPLFFFFERNTWGNLVAWTIDSCTCCEVLDSPSINSIEKKASMTQCLTVQSRLKTIIHDSIVIPLQANAACGGRSMGEDSVGSEGTH